MDNISIKVNIFCGYAELKEIMIILTYQNPVDTNIIHRLLIPTGHVYLSALSKPVGISALIKDGVRYDLENIQ